MIFVTVGTTMPFDALIREVDELVATGTLREQVIAQIGNGRYAPNHIDSFRFKPSVDDLMREATLVVSHGGTGSVFTLLRYRRPFLAVANPAADGDPQKEFLQAVGKAFGIHWTDDVKDIGSLVGRVATVSYSGDRQRTLGDAIRGSLKAP